MPSEQATAAAEEIVNGDGKWGADPKEVKRVAEIIDAAFAPVVKRNYTCLFCGEDCGDLGTLQAHSGKCKKHPLHPAYTEKK